MAYAETRAANPGALGLTIGLNCLAVLALAAWNPSMFHIPTPPWITVPIPPIEPPPPQHPEDTKVRTKTSIDHPTKTVNTGAKAEDWKPIDIDPGTTVLGGDGGVGSGFGTGPIAEPPPPIHQPVKRGVTMTNSGELQPPYPPALQRAEVEGSVAVRVLVGTDGRPRDIVLLRSDDPGFFAAAKSWGMRHWRFKPATEDGTAVESWFTLNIRFTLN